VTDAAALQIQICVRAVRHLGAPMAEAGVLMGGSARLICESKGDVPLLLFDVFECLQGAGGPADSPGTADVRSHFGRVHGSRAWVERLLAGYPAVRIHPGIFPQSAKGLEEARFSFVHLDLDLPRGTREALDFFHPKMLAGGIIVGDDYDDPAVRKVFMEFFSGRPDTLIGLPWGQVMVVKQRES